MLAACAALEYITLTEIRECNSCFHSKKKILNMLLFFQLEPDPSMDSSTRLFRYVSSDILESHGATESV